MPRPETLDVLARLVGFDTVSRNSNLDLIAYVREHLEGLGVPCRLIPDETGAKANLFATIGPADRPGVILSGHVDVVPVDGQSWSSDPFALTERGGRYFARGAADMKGFDAVVLAAARAMAEAPLRHPIHIALSYDEEVGCVGVRGLIAALADDGLRPLACVVGEPTSMRVVVGHKGKRSLRVTVRGRECHSAAAPRGVNAVEYAARLAVFVSDAGRRLAASGRRDPMYDPPHTTAHVGTLEGGTALNIVPNRAHLDFEFRNLPEDDADALVAEVERYARDELEPAMRAVDPATGIDFEPLAGIAGLDTAPDAPAVAFVQQLVGGNGDAARKVGKVSFGTEAGLFHEGLSVPSVVCGPGDIEQAHKPDEYVTAGQLEAAEGFVGRLIDRLCRPDPGL